MKRLRLSDKKLLSAIREMLETRPSYGYRRVTAILNCQYKASETPKINHKRVYRIMKENRLLLTAFGKKATRTHDGKIITLRSNTRWCSDGFCITCDNGDRVYVAFSLDTCDREVMRYVASTKGVDGEMIRDLMIESVEYRFGSVDKVPSPIQWLSDNGPCYTARKTVALGRTLGFEVCTTAPYNPESNGMAEALVKTIKRDYIWFGDLKDAQTVMRQLPIWFNDYNEHAPHKGLKMHSPRQFIKEGVLV